MTNVKPNETKDVKNTTKEDKPKVLTIATVFKKIAVVGVKDRKDLATKIIAEFHKNGIYNNIKGKEIKEERVLQQISAMLRDIKTERGKEKNSWWSQYKIEEDDKSLKIVLKK